MFLHRERCLKPNIDSVVRHGGGFETAREQSSRESFDYMSTQHGHNDQGNFTRHSQWCEDYPPMCSLVVNAQSFRTDSRLMTKTKWNTFRDLNNHSDQLEMSLCKFCFSSFRPGRICMRSRAWQFNRKSLRLLFLDQIGWSDKVP